MSLLLESKNVEGISRVMRDTFVRSSENETIGRIDSNTLYGWPMCQSSAYLDLKNDKHHNNILGEIIRTPDENEIGCFIEVYLGFPQIIRQKN